MKIAVITDDGKTISQHFGRASYYVVYTVDEGNVTASEKREKAGHHTFGGQHEKHGHGEEHGFGNQAQSRHTTMAETISDCQVLIAGGMGRGAYESMKIRNIEALVTDVTNMDEAVDRYIKGNLPNLMDRLH